MKEEILAQLDHPKELERLYRKNNTLFKQSFDILYPELQGNSIAEFWNSRLHYEREEFNWGSSKELLFIIGGCFVAGIIAKLPSIFHWNEDFFYPRNIGFVVFPLLIAYFSWKKALSKTQMGATTLLIIVSLIFINFLPDVHKSDTLLLSCIHLPIVLWFLLLYSYAGTVKNNLEGRLDFLKFNGDLVVMTALILIAGALLSGLTVGLFSLIGFNIEKFYFENIIVFGLAGAPILGTYLVQSNPQLVGKVSPVIAKIFSPLVLVMLVIYLIAMIYSGKDPYNDRQFLMIFNALLLGVMCLIFFNAADTAAESKTRAGLWILFLLSIVTIIVNGIALSAILFRIAEWGFTPNRAAVLGGNGLILINLFLVGIQLYKVLFRKANIDTVGKAIALYLPIYLGWAAVVTFFFPFLFGFK